MADEEAHTDPVERIRTLDLFEGRQHLSLRFALLAMMRKNVDIQQQAFDLEDLEASSRHRDRLERAGYASLPLHRGLSNPGVSVCDLRRVVRKYPMSVRQRDRDGRLALHVAAAAVNGFEVIKYLVRLWPGSLRVKDRRGRVPLHSVMARNGYWSWLEAATLFLVKKWPESIRQRDSLGQLPLHVALAKDGVSLYTVQFLIEQWHGSLRARDGQGRVPMHVAGAKSYHDLCGPLSIMKLVRAAWPGSLQARDVSGRIPLHAAADAKAGWQEARFLVDKWPESLLVTDGRGRLPLHAAAARALGRYDLVEHLADQCPEALVWRDHLGRLPLQILIDGFVPTAERVARLARALERYNLVWHLADKCPEALAERDHLGRLPLQLLIDGLFPTAEEVTHDMSLHLITELSVLHPYLLGLRDGRGRLPLHVAIAPATNKPNWELVRRLLEMRRGSARSWDGASGLPPVLLAAIHGAPIDVLYRLAVEAPGLLERCPE
jgi:hypothetical protein